MSETNEMKSARPVVEKLEVLREFVEGNEDACAQMLKVIDENARLRRQRDTARGQGAIEAYQAALNLVRSGTPPDGLAYIISRNIADLTALGEEAGGDHSRLQEAMWPLMRRGCGGFTPDQICRALHAAFDGDVERALAVLDGKDQT